MSPTPPTIAPRTYEPKNYDRLIGTRGFSEDLLRTHFGLYQGYVKHTNACLALLRGGTQDPYAAGEVRRRLGWEFNGMRLHELYFDGMQSGGSQIALDSPFRAAIALEFGSFESWWAQFQKLGGMRGIGWGVLSYDASGNRFINTWINEHDAGALAGTSPLLVLDLFEHAYMRDYNTDRAGYLKAFSEAVDWAVCEKRWNASGAASATPP